MSKSWIKRESDALTAYFVHRNEYEILFYDSDKPVEAIAKELNDKYSYGNFHYNRVNDKVLAFRGSRKQTPEMVELPAGAYKYNNDIYPWGEGLEVINVRKNENYIELDEQNYIKNDISKFLSKKSVYTDLDFIYRRGYLMYGPPGNGKTALIRALTQDPQFKDAIIIWLSDIPGTGICQALNSTDRLKVLVFEEIINQHGDVNFHTSQLLDFLDGEGSLNNCITIATTNYPHQLHANLADRPSRFDIVCEIKGPSKEMQQKVLESFLGRFLLSDEFEFDNFSFAQLKEIVLLHKLHDITLKDAALRMKEQSERFKRGFEEKKKFGFGEE